MDVKEVAAKLKQGQIKYRPELLKDLYLSICVSSSNKTLQKDLAQINNANNQTLKTNYSLHDIDGQRTLYIRKLNVPGYLKAGKDLSDILFLTDNKSFWGLLLSNKCLANVNAPYRIFLLDATADMTKKYGEISKIKTKNKRAQELFKLAYQCILLVNIKDFSYSLAIPCETNLDFDQDLQTGETTVEVDSGLRHVNDQLNGEMVKNVIETSLEQIQALLKPIPILKFQGYPVFYMNYNHDVCLFDGRYDYDKTDLADARTIIKTADFKDVINWLNNSNETMRVNIMRFLQTQYQIGFNAEGKLELNLRLDSPFWQKLFKQIKITDPQHLTKNYFTPNFELKNVTKDINDIVGQAVIPDVSDDIANILLSAIVSTKYQNNELIETIKMPATTAIKVENLPVRNKKQPKIKPLTKAKGLNNVLQMVTQENKVFYNKQKLITLEKKLDDIIIRKEKLV